MAHRLAVAAHKIDFFKFGIGLRCHLKRGFGEGFAHLPVQGAYLVRQGARLAPGEQEPFS